MTLMRTATLLTNSILLTYLLIGCATPPRGATVVDDSSKAPGIYTHYAGQLSQLKIGMSLTKFHELLPQAYVAGQNNDQTAYELIYHQKYVTQDDMDQQNFWWGFGSPQAKIKEEVLWFYFFDDKLSRWGKPNDWVKEPDVVIEKRIR